MLQKCLEYLHDFMTQPPAIFAKYRSMYISFLSAAPSLPRVFSSYPIRPPLLVLLSKSYAKSHYLLSPSQVAKLPTLYAEQAEETGCQFSKEAGVTVAVCSAAKSSAVAR